MARTNRFEVCNMESASKLEAGGKPSTWFPPGRLVEHIYLSKNLKLRHNHQHEEKNNRSDAQTYLTELTPDTYTQPPMQQIVHHTQCAR